MTTVFTTVLMAIFQILTVVLLAIGFHANAENTYKSFNISDTKRLALTVEDLRSRFELTTQIVVSNGEGRILHLGRESRFSGFDDKGKLSVYEMWRQPEVPDLALKMLWKLADDGQISVHIQQFESMSASSDNENPKIGKLIREQSISVKDFAPIEWLAFSDSQRRVLMRMRPELSDKAQEPIDVEAAALSFDNAVVFDSKGNFWARTDGNLEGRYLALKTHKGQVALSFVPFQGAKEIGVAKGSQVTVNGGPNLKIFLRSSSPVVTGTRPAKVYGIVDLKKTSSRPTSVHAQSGDKEKEFLRDL